MILTIISMVKLRLITSDTQRRDISRMKSNVRLNTYACYIVRVCHEL